MSLDNLYKEKMFVLGPLELSPGQFAVGERSYAAIKGNMPYYNELRQKLYLDGHKEAGDAIGELESRATTAEAALERMTSAKKSAETKVKSLTEQIETLNKEHAEELKKAVTEAKRDKKEKKDAEKAAAAAAKEEIKLKNKDPNYDKYRDILK